MRRVSSASRRGAEDGAGVELGYGFGGSWGLFPQSIPRWARVRASMWCGFIELGLSGGRWIGTKAYPSTWPARSTRNPLGLDPSTH